MIETFEIGVSLALQDGVSDAIGKAQRDVAALEHAVRASGVSVQSLRDAGVKASSVSFGDQRSQAPEKPATLVVPDAVPRVEGKVESAPFVALLGAARAERPGVVTQEAVVPRVDPVARKTELAAPQPAIAATQSAIAAAPPAIAAPVASIPTATPSLGVAHFIVGEPVVEASESDRAGPIQATAPLVALGLADGPEGAPVAGERGAAPVAFPMQETPAERPALLGALALPVQTGPPLLRQENDAPEFPWPGQPVYLPDRHWQRPDGNVSLLAALQLSGGAVVDPQDETQQVAQGVTTPGAGAEMRTEQQPQAPVVATRANGAAPAGGAVASGMRADTGLQHPEAAATGPREGDVFLDGMLVGRWVSRFLNREAERASAGPTGFDARRGRLLPGVTVGA